MIIQASFSMRKRSMQNNRLLAFGGSGFQRRTWDTGQLLISSFSALFLLDEEEEHAEAEQEDGQDVQEDAGEAEAAEEEGEVREVAQEEEAASPLKCCLNSTRLHFKKKWLLSNKEALFQGSFQDASQFVKSCQPQYLECQLTFLTPKFWITCTK